MDSDMGKDIERSMDRDISLFGLQGSLNAFLDLLFTRESLNHLLESPEYLAPKFVS